MRGTKDSGIVVGGGKRRLHLGPRARLALLVGAAVLLVGAIAGGSYLVWQRYNDANPNKDLPVVDSAKVAEQYAEDIKNIKVPEGENKTGVLRVQMGTVYAQGDYTATIAYAEELLNVPGYQNDVDSLRFIALSYDALGKKTERQEAQQKIVDYYDANPAEKENPLGKNLYAEAKKGLE
jgi:hypothetical protein